LKHENLSEEVQSTAALYALGALSQSEARAFEAHLEEGCENCLIELGGFEEVAGLLGLSSIDANPPDYLRDMLALRISNEEEAKQFETKLDLSNESPHAGSIAYLEPSKSRKGGDLWRVVLPWVIAASLVIALTASLLSWRAERKSYTGTIAELSQERDEMGSEMTELNHDLLKKNVELGLINSVLDSPRLRVINLKGQGEVAQESSGKIYWDEQQNKWVVSAKLPPAPEGKVYQLWFVTPDQKISAGLLQTDMNGQGLAMMDVPGAPGSLAAAAITLEPAGGSEQPTLPIYLMGQPGS
jgi:anti-sigma-K factor RskA